ncbi:MAG: hypothetical protein AAGH78_13670 [Cyanobacteria bacterium P01_H01_bin.58]
MQWLSDRLFNSVLYGAVSTGDVWQFGRLHRAQRQIEQDLNPYRMPADLDELFRILIALLTIANSGF